MTSSQVRNVPESKEYFFEEGCFILEMLNTASDPDVSIARARVESGKTTRFHRLKNVTERYVIQQGCGLVFIGNEAAQAVQVGSVVVIPAGVRQKIYNSGADVLVFLAICSPRFTPECYEDCDV
ncbi:MAG: mannose-6-phosphate isomerase-like protein (cupin superfamily) [Oleiphilaceae bacterium]|jgi:mannose-6-phosphate isomerase-like protein (cupin superfamily)